MFVIPILPWTWLTIKFKCFRLDKLPSPSASGLACLLDPHYLGCDGLPSLSVLSLTSLLGPRYLGHGWLSSSSVLDLTSYFSNSYYLGLNWLSNLIALNLAECQVQVSWIWHICQFHVILRHGRLPSPNILHLAYLSNSCYFRHDWLLSLIVLSLISLSNSCYFKFSWIWSSSVKLGILSSSKSILVWLMSNLVYPRLEIPSMLVFGLNN